MNDDQAWRTERILRIAEDDQRRRLIESYPQIKADVDLMAAMIRELVNLEREKLGLDRPRGFITLYLNRERKNAHSPDLTGSGKIAGRQYQAAGWISGKEKIRVAVFPKAK